MEAPKIDKCKNIQDLPTLDKCYLNLALETKNEHYCSKMSSIYKFQTHCLEALAAFKNNPGLCPREKFCPEYVFLQNTELCSDIKIDMIAMTRYCYLYDPMSKQCELENSKINKKAKCIKNITSKQKILNYAKK